MSLKLNKEKYTELLHKSKYIFDDNHEIKGNDFYKIIAFHNSFKTEETGMSVLSTIETYFIRQSATDEERIQLTEKIYNWCWENNIPLYNTIITLTGLFISMQVALTESLYKNIFPNANDMFDYNNEDNKKFVYNEVLNSFMESIDQLLNEPRELIHNPEIYEELVRNTYNEVRKRTKRKIDNIELPLSQYAIDYKKVINDITSDEINLIDMINRPKKFSKIKQSNHFAHHLMYDDLDITEDGEFIFGKHTEALSSGYTSKAILLSIDKNIAIRELKTKLKHLKDYPEEKRGDLVPFTESLINFINQKKYANIIPFKALSKEIGITKNQAKNYAKQLFSINDKSFINNFDELTLFENK